MTLLIIVLESLDRYELISLLIYSLLLKQALNNS